MNRNAFFEKFLKPEQLEANKNNPAFWSRETKMFSQLVKKYGNEFFEQLNLGYQLNSLAFLKSVRGKDTLLQKHNEYIFDLKNKPAAPPILLKERLGEDKIVKMQYYSRNSKEKTKEWNNKRAYLLSLF